MGFDIEQLLNTFEEGREVDLRTGFPFNCYLTSVNYSEAQHSTLRLGFEP